MADFVAHLANCLIDGDSFTEVDGNKIKNKISLELENLSIDIIQFPDKLISKINQGEYHSKFFQTTRIIIKDVSEGQLEICSSLVTKLSSMLSFITNSQVVSVGYEYPEGHIKQHSGYYGHINIYNSVLENHRGDEIKDFISSTWQNYTRYYESRKFPLLFDYIFQAFSVNTIETKLVFSYVALESLKYTFAKEKGLTFSKGFFQDHNKKQLSFNNLIEMMLSEVGINFNVNEITGLRNDIIHSGYTEKSFNHNFKIFIYCQHIIRDYLIKLLGYKGYYILVR
ncbi:MAG TPA: hypothetical protein VLH59_04320 [Ignavibacteriaceae bacterium]|nr:hypothetical protein [Ignavibacteriaceae bacterium]